MQTSGPKPVTVAVAPAIPTPRLCQQILAIPIINYSHIPKGPRLQQQPLLRCEMIPFGLDASHNISDDKPFFAKKEMYNAKIKDFSKPYARLDLH